MIKISLTARSRWLDDFRQPVTLNHNMGWQKPLDCLLEAHSFPTFLQKRVSEIVCHFCGCLFQLFMETPDTFIFLTQNSLGYNYMSNRCLASLLFIICTNIACFLVELPNLVIAKVISRFLGVELNREALFFEQAVDRKTLKKSSKLKQVLTSVHVLDNILNVIKSAYLTINLTFLFNLKMLLSSMILLFSFYPVIKKGIRYSSIEIS